MRVYFRLKNGRFAKPSSRRKAWTAKGRQLYGAAKVAAVRKQAKSRRVTARRRHPAITGRIPAGVSPIFADYVVPIDQVSGRSTRQVYALVRFDITDEFHSNIDSPPYELDESIKNADPRIGISTIVPVKLPRQPVGWYRKQPDNQIINMVEMARGKAIASVIDANGDEQPAYYGLVVKKTLAECRQVGKRQAAARARKEVREKKQGSKVGRTWRHDTKNNRTPGQAKVRRPHKPKGRR